MKLNFGVRAHDVGQGSPEDIFKKTGDFGFDYVQLVYRKALVNASYDEQYTDRVKKALDDHNIKVAMLGAYFNPVHSDKSIVKKGIEEFKNNLRIAASLKTEIVGSETGSYNDSPWTFVPENHTEKGFAETLGVFRELKEYAFSLQTGISVEPAWGHIIYDCKTLKRFVDKLNDRGNIFVTIDLYNLLNRENEMNHREIFKEALQTFKEQIKIIHLKDFVIENDRIKQVAPGQGNFDYPYMFAMIKEHCPKAICIFEGVVEPDLKPSFSYLRSVE